MFIVLCEVYMSKISSQWQVVVIGNIIAPKDAHSLSLVTCEYVACHGKRDFVVLFKIEDVKMRLS